MFCPNCGEQVMENEIFCQVCGTQQASLRFDVLNASAVSIGSIGYSNKISDPAFAKYIKNTNRWSAIFAVILAIAAIIGFTFAGEIGAEGMENPQALFIGLGIGGMFLLIALLQVLGRKRSRTWDGVVTDKKINKKHRRQSSGDEDYWVDYSEYVVSIRADNGKAHSIKVDDDATLYNYYQIGDRVRHHAGLNTYEKYDKSKDSVIFCAACASMNDMKNDYCFRCKCPLLK